MKRNRCTPITRSKASVLRGAPALLVLMAAAPPVLAGGDAATLTLRVSDPAVVAFDSTALGRATHPLRLVVANQGTQAITLEPLALWFRPVRDGIAFACEESKSRDDRWPATLEPGGTFAFAREITCDTPLPGRYDVEVRGRARSAAAATERKYGSFTLQIDPGTNPPVRIPWEPSLYGAASGTKDMRPTKDPAAARIVVAMINPTRAPVTLAPVRATMRIKRRGYSIQACADRSADLAFSGTLAPGGAQRLATPLGCDISAEGLYDVEVSVANASGVTVRLATHAIRVTVNAPASPGPRDSQKDALLGGS